MHLTGLGQSSSLHAPGHLAGLARVGPSPVTTRGLRPVAHCSMGPSQGCGAGTELPSRWLALQCLCSLGLWEAWLPHGPTARDCHSLVQVVEGLGCDCPS